MTKSKKPEFRPNEFVVYPAHGVGKILSIEEQEIAGFKLELFVIHFEKDKMTLRVPTHKAVDVGMRALSAPDVVTKALDTLKGKARVKRAMWSRRAQEYEQKINSGDLMAIAEVVRDLHRTDDQREQSYSERQLYEAALERLTREVAAVAGLEPPAAAKKVDDVLLTRAATAEGDDPVLGPFLDFLARDLAHHPERLRAVDAGLAQRLQSLVSGVEVDLDATLPADDE